MGSVYVGTTGRTFYVVAQNGNSDPTVATDWLGPVSAIGDAHPWGSTDLFATTYNMTALPGSGPKVPVPPKAPPQIFATARAADAIRAVKPSMSATRLLIPRRRGA